MSVLDMIDPTNLGLTVTALRERNPHFKDARDAEIIARIEDVARRVEHGKPTYVSSSGVVACGYFDPDRQWRIYLSINSYTAGGAAARAVWVAAQEVYR